MLMTHYRQPIDWTVSALTEAERVLTDWQRLAAQFDVRDIEIKPEKEVAEALLDDLNTPEVIGCVHQLAKASQKDIGVRRDLYANLVFLGLLPDQLSLAKSVAVGSAKAVQLPEHVDDQILNKYRPKLISALETSFSQLPPAAHTTGTISTASWLLGVNPTSVPVVNEWTKYNPGYISSEDRAHIEEVVGIRRLNQLIDARLQARVAKDFMESDRIRDELAALRISLKDSKDGPTWEVAR
jgi:cysteinyl-tRNA synthetase